MTNYKTVSFYTNKREDMRTLHIETEGCIVNIRVGLHDRLGRKVTSIKILPDGYVGEPKRKLVGTASNRVIQLKKRRGNEWKN